MKNLAASRYRLAPFSLLTLLSTAGCDRGKGGEETALAAQSPSPSTEAIAATPPPSQPSVAQLHEAEPESSSMRAGEPWTQPALPPDQGIFPEYDSAVRASCPSWIGESPPVTARAEKSGRAFHLVGGVPLCPSSHSPKADARTPITLSSWGSADQDQDGLPTQWDILRGAKKAVKNSASYKSTYRKLDFPGGDVPRSEGVCTDVIIRALRNDGIDLQKLIADDIKARPRAYPMVKKADTHIDHRRVRTILPYFKRWTQELTKDPSDPSSPYFPGDIVFMNTMGGPEPEHLGIVSDILGKSGLPMVINNWTDGSQTAEMDLLGWVPVTHRFRVAKPISGSELAGLSGLLKRRPSFRVPEESRQAILVISPLWSSPTGELRHYERPDAKSPWQQLGRSVPVRVGSAGFGRGIGVSAGDAPLEKKEGDKRAVSGVFLLGTAFGRKSSPPYAGTWPYRTVARGDFWVDESTSPVYNTWQKLSPQSSPPWSAEDLTIYSLGLVVEHNIKKPIGGRGSAIFMHPWSNKDRSTLGCTAMPQRSLEDLLTWLRPEKSPVLIQLAGQVLTP